MNRTLIGALTIVFLLVAGTSARADLQCRPIRTKDSLTLFTMMVLPLRVFVTVTQSPVIFASKSVTGILRQVLMGRPRTHGREFQQSLKARI